MSDDPSDEPPASDPGRPSSPFSEWAHLSQPTPPSPPPAAAPTPLIRPPAQPHPQSEPGPGAGQAYPPPPLPGYAVPVTARPLFPPAPPGLYPTPDDPLVSADFNGWWRRSFRLLRAIWRPAALVQLVWVGPVVVSGLLVVLFLGDTFNDLVTTPDGAQPDWHAFLRALYFLVPLGLLTGLLSLLASLATMHLVVQAAVGRPPSARDALRTAGPRLPAYTGWGFLGGLVTLAGFVCCILPGYYVTAVLLILPTAVLLERGNAVARCFRLFHARLGDAVARVATIIGLGFGIGIVEQVLLGSVASLFGLFGTDGIPWPAFFAVSVLALVLSAASTIMLAPMNVTAYADMRARYEPFSTAYLTVEQLPRPRERRQP